MKVEHWSKSRPISPWLPAPRDRSYVGDEGSYALGRPELDAAECNVCGLCWIYCPEGAITKPGGKIVIDYEDCRGCGICAEECPRGLIRLVEGIA